MHIQATSIPGLLIVELNVHHDNRGSLVELWHHARYTHSGIDSAFLQDTLSRSSGGTLRGLHYQHPRGQGKLISCVHGRVFDVIVDIRRGSPAFGKWFSFELDDTTERQLWVPPGLAHGFCVLSTEALILYKSTLHFVQGEQCGIRWNDPTLGIAWPLDAPRISERDQALPFLDEAQDLPVFDPQRGTS